MAFAPLSVQGKPAGRIGLGTWALGGGKDWGPVDRAQALDTVAAALEQGICLFDVSPIYGQGLAEEILAQALKGRRSRVLLADKCGIIFKSGRPDHNLRAASILAECDASLSRLQTDYIDLYQIHWPDPNVPLEEALKVLERLKEQGKIRAAGVCNVSATQLDKALAYSQVACVQGPLSLLSARPDSLAVCQEKQIPFYAYGALGGGILSGKYKSVPNFRRCDARRYFYKYYFGPAFEQAQKAARRVCEVAQAKQLPPAAVALGWVLQQPGVSGVLAGARSAAQVQANVLAAGVTLSAQEKEYLQYGKH